MFKTNKSCVYSQCYSELMICILEVYQTCFPFNTFAKQIAHILTLFALSICQHGMYLFQCDRRLFIMSARKPLEVCVYHLLVLSGACMRQTAQAGSHQKSFMVVQEVSVLKGHNYLLKENSIILRQHAAFLFP